MSVVRVEIDVELDDIPEDVLVEYLQEKGYLVRECSSLDDNSKKEILESSWDKFTSYQLESIVK